VIYFIYLFARILNRVETSKSVEIIFYSCYSITFAVLFTLLADVNSNVKPGYLVEILMLYAFLGISHYLLSEYINAYEQQWYHANWEKKQLQEEINHYQKLDALGKLAGGVAHDFNNSLQAIMGGAEMLTLGTPGKLKVKKIAENILNVCEQSTSLTEKLLTFARKGIITSETINLNHLLLGLDEILRHTFDKRIIIRTTATAGSAMIKGDFHQIQNALMNLAFNSRDALASGGEIKISTLNVDLSKDHQTQFSEDITPGRYIELTVSDNGSGIAPEYLKHVFEPFFTTKGKTKGTGLGLAMVYGCVKQHEGYIKVDSKIDRGTTFQLYFPLQKDTHAVEPEAPVKGPRFKRSHGHILIIDDEKSILHNTSQILKKHGFHCDTFDNPIEAMNFFDRNHKKIDLILVDMMMPDMNGYQCFRNFRKTDPSIRVILMTGYSLQKEVRAMIGEGLNGLLRKPFQSGELLQKISEAQVH
jgi:two-component system, cell cycle sensor histidine kinase and response regulator CckA